VAIRIKQTDITLQDTDIIVNPSNIYLQAVGGISGQIVLRGGSKIQTECHKWVKKFGPVSTGTCAFTNSGDLACKYIIHTPGPIWANYQEKKSLELLKSCVYKTLELTKKLDCADKKNGSTP
jgi:O-acetyl-ADP-ribose deacetylase (regulator of RNase III)